MLLLTGTFCLIIGIWLGRKWRSYKINNYKKYLADLLQKANQLHYVNKQLAKEVKFHRKAERSAEIEEMKAGVIDAATELMVEIV